MVDFEDSGAGDQFFEVGDMIEHLQSDRVSPDAWESLVASLGLTRDQLEAVRHGQRTMATFWLAQLLADPRAAAMNPPDRARRQAERVRALLHTTSPA
jgi:hypothetical protein